MKKQVLLVCGILSVSVGVMAMQKEERICVAPRCVMMMPGAVHATPHGTMPGTRIVPLCGRKKKSGALSEASDAKSKVSVVEIGDSEGEQAAAWAVLKGFLACGNWAFHSGGNLQLSENDQNEPQ